MGEHYTIFIYSSEIARSAGFADGQDIAVPIGESIRLAWAFFEAVSVSQNVGFMTCLSKALHHQLRAFLEVSNSHMTRVYIIICVIVAFLGSSKYHEID